MHLENFSSLSQLAPVKIQPARIRAYELVIPASLCALTPNLQQNVHKRNGHLAIRIIGSGSVVIAALYVCWLILEYIGDCFAKKVVEKIKETRQQEFIEKYRLAHPASVSKPAQKPV
jgi:hypothetical protein